jgi:thimet oligopeptidase
MDAATRLDLWNDADLALRQATCEAYLLSEAHPDAEVRRIAEEQVQALEALSASRLLDAKLFAAFEALTDDALDADQARLLAQVRRDFHRGGVGLPAADRERVRAHRPRHGAESGVLTQHPRRTARDPRRPAALAGLPQDFIDAHPVDHDGLIVLTTEYTDLMPVREYATDRATRTALVAAYNDLAWPVNDAVLAELLAVRAERAQLLGYRDWADYETETRMIGADRVDGGSAAIAEFLARLDDASADAAAREYPVLLERLQQDDPAATEVTIADFFYLQRAAP